MPGTAALRGLADPFDPIAGDPRLRPLSRAISPTASAISGLPRPPIMPGRSASPIGCAATAGLPYETRDFVALDHRPQRRGLERVPASPSEPAERGLPPDERPPGLPRRRRAPRKARRRDGEWSPTSRRPTGRPGACRSPAISRSTAQWRAMPIQERHADILGGQPPMVVRAFNRSRGRRRSSSSGFLRPKPQRRHSLCRKLHAAGSACVVFRN